MSKLPLALRFLDLLNGGQIEEALGCLAQDFQFTDPGGATKTRDELATFFAGIGQVFAGPYEQRIVGTTSEGDRVAIEAEGKARLVNGRTYMNRYHFLFEFRGELIQSWREYCDTRAIDAAFAP